MLTIIRIIIIFPLQGNRLRRDIQMSFRSALLQDRYSAFETYRMLSPFYDEELASHIVLNFDDVMASLKAPSLSSNRKKAQFDSVRSCPFSSPLLDFYGQWLMYMDGDAHIDARRLITVALSRAGKNVEEIVDRCFRMLLPRVFHSQNQTQDLVTAFSAPFVTSVLAAVFGVSPEKYKQIIEISKPIVLFLGNGDAGNGAQRRQVVESLDITNKLLLSCIQECGDPESVIGYLLNNNVAVNAISPLLINIVIDGYDPLLAAINTYLLKLSQGLLSGNNIPGGHLFEELVRLETPFQYCARIATEDFHLGNYSIRRGERVMSFISAANRDPEYFPMPEKILLRDQKYKSVSFGAGRHVCPGGNMTKKIVTRLLILMETVNSGVDITHMEDEWLDTFGFRFLKTLSVRINRQKEKTI